MLGTHFPQCKAAGGVTRRGVRHVKNISESWLIAAGVDERDAGAAALHIAPRALFPEVILRARRRVWALGVDHKLLVVGVLVKPRRRSEKGRPALIAASDLPCGALGKFRIEL